MTYSFDWLDPGVVDDGDETFRVRRRYPSALAESIERCGLQTPVLLEPIIGSAPQRYRLVSGWGRWLYRPNGLEVPAFVLPAGLEREAVWDEFVRRNDRWNVMEVARISARLRELPGLDPDRLVREKFPLLGLRASLELYRQHLRLLDLGEAAREFVEEGDLPLKRASALLKLPPETTDEVILASRQLHLSLNELAEVLEHLEEISHRDGVAPGDVLRAAQADLAGGGKRAFRLYLHERRYPRLRRYRAELEAYREALRYTMPVRVEWDPQLERPGIRLTVDLSCRRALEDFASQSEENRAALERFFEIL